MSSPETTQTEQSVDFAELEKSIQAIITLTNKIEERYRAKCFEILLNFYLMEKAGKPIGTSVKEKLKKEETVKESFEVPIDVKAFLTQQGIPEEIISKLFLISKGQIRPIYKITTSNRAEGQIQVALLTALEHAIKASGNKFEFSMETVRTLCKKFAVYDTANFKKNFTSKANLFNGLTDEEHVELSPDGQTELAEIILTVTK